MRHFYLTISATAILLLAACGEASINDSIELPSSDTVAADSKLDSENTGQTESSNHDEADGPKEEVSKAIDDTDLPENFRGLNPNDISRAEIDELLILQNLTTERFTRFQKELLNWKNAENTVTQGPEPTWSDFSFSREENHRFDELNAKLSIASKRKRYERYGPDILSKAEVDELVSLEHKRNMAILRKQKDYKKNLNIWNEQDAAIRGERPSQKGIYSGLRDTRLFELRSKTQSVDRLNRLKTRESNLSSTHNLLLLDSDISEWVKLEKEAAELQVEFFKVMNAAEDEKQFDGGEDINESDFIERVFADAFPKNKAQRMFEIAKRMDAIEAPLKAAEIADRTRKNMSRRSERAGVSISSREIRETIDLKVELDRIKNRAEFEAQEKWLEEGGPMPTGRPQPNAEDAARIKEINARIKEISAPMDEALMDLK